MYTKDLEQLIQTEEVRSNPVLRNDLEELLKANYFSVTKYLSDIQLDSYKYLLENKHITLSAFLDNILRTNTEGSLDLLLDFALSLKPNFEELYYLPINLSKSDVDKLVASGLSLNKIAKLILLISYHEDQKEEINSQLQFINYLVERGASFEDLSYIPNHFSIKTCKLLIDNGLKVEILFQHLLQLPEGEKRTQIFDLLLANKMDFSDYYFLDSYPSFDEFQKIIEAGFSVEGLVISFLKHMGTAYKQGSIEAQPRVLSENEVKLLEFFISKGGDLSEAFSEIAETVSVAYINENCFPNLIPKPILETLVKNYDLNPSLVLMYAITNKVHEFAQFAIEAGADVNYRADDTEHSFYVQALHSNLLEVAKLLVEAGASQEIDINEYVFVLRNLDFNLAQKLVIKYSEKFSNEQIYESLRSLGTSESTSRALLDYHDLVKEYLLAKQGKATSLSDLEISILEGDASLEDLSLYNRKNISNKYGFNPLHLSIISKQYAFAGALIRNGYDVNKKSHNKLLPLQLLAFMDSDNNEVLQIGREVLDLVENIDINLGSGETLTDMLITHKDLQEQVIEKTKDPLFYFFKNDTDLFCPSKIPEKTYIAISHGDDFWSTGVWSTARIAREKYPNVSFYIVTSEMLEKGGESFIRQFDAVVNPGAGDSYPKLAEFKKEDCSFSMIIERHYQDILEISHKHNIPYLGMCAGAQHFSMYHEGTLSPLKGYNKGEHQVTYQKATLPYFMALTKDQQKALLETCEFPDISFKGDTAHSFAAVYGKLGTGIELGAVSEDNIPMSYGHENGIRYVTQFHPEHYYDNLDNAKTINQKAWIDNFIELAVMHHDHRVEGSSHPIEYFAQIRIRLDECAAIQADLSGDSAEIMLKD